MNRKALLIGVNDYLHIGDLRGCVNDVTNVRHLLMRYYGLSPERISLLVDHSATKDRIKKRYDWLIDGARAGDHLLFHFSGHGSYVRDFDGDEKRRALRDETDELACLYDMNWRDPNTYVIDDEFGAMFKCLPKEVQLTVILDCCHSGTGTRAGITPPPDLHPRRGIDWGKDPCDGSGGFDWGASGRSSHPTIDRFAQPPTDIEARIDERETPNRRRLARGNGGTCLNHVLLTGCRDDQTSADAFIGGAYNGAFTFYMCKAVREADGNISYNGLIQRVRHSLRFNNFAQQPQLEGEGLDRGFLK